MKVESIIRRTALLAGTFMSASFVQAATITAVGLDITTQANWRTTTTVKSFDTDQDNVYGTAGYYAWATRTTGQGNAFVANPNAATILNGLPAYVTLTPSVSAPLQSFATTGYPLFDNPTLTPGASVADIHSGYMWSNNARTNATVNLFDITFGPGTPANGVRVGVVYNNSGGTNVVGYRLGGAVQSLATTTGVSYSFFDVTNINPLGETVTLQVTNGTVDFSDVGASALTFDVIPEPSTALLGGLGLLALLRRRR